MKFSICTTNYNCAHALENHINSIYTQFEFDEFEYIVVDSKSYDGSIDILCDFEKSHKNMRVISRKCTRGRGRQIAFENSSGNHIISVDTDEVYYPVLREFINAALKRFPEFAIQTFNSGIIPREILLKAGGWRSLNMHDDLDLWMRIWQLGKMRWYPIWTGENIKEDFAEAGSDHLSSRYNKFDRFRRLLRSEYDRFKTRKWQKYDLDKVWNENVIDLGLAKLEGQLFTNKPKRTFFGWWKYMGIEVKKILRG